MEQIQIVVGVLKKNHEVLISLRQKHQTYAGCWEFPGGRVEVGENLTEALVREFKEEVGVTTTNWQALIQIPWFYRHARVLLHVFVSRDFNGEAIGKEGQKIKWVAKEQLCDYKFPEANDNIRLALSLPDSFAISGSFQGKKDGLRLLQNTLETGIKLIQLRAKSLNEQAFIDFAKPAIELAHKYQAKVLLNSPPRLLEQLGQADGLQLSSTAVKNLIKRPISKDKLLSVSTHNKAEITKALELGADIILLSPVKKTSSHPNLEAMGWDKFTEFVADIPVPVYALGGMKMEDKTTAKQSGAQGIAAISSFWKTN
jgi:8-oxo-dGTP diphosphatase